MASSMAWRRLASTPAVSCCLPLPPLADGSSQSVCSLHSFCRWFADPSSSPNSSRVPPLPRPAPFPQHGLLVRRALPASIPSRCRRERAAQRNGGPPQLTPSPPPPTARVFANGPLRAKEASPFVSSKYPVIVRHTSYLTPHHPYTSAAGRGAREIHEINKIPRCRAWTRTRTSNRDWN